MAAMAVLINGKVAIVSLLRPLPETRVGQLVKYRSRRGNIRNAIVVFAGEGRHWLRRPKQKDVFIRQWWEVFGR